MELEQNLTYIETDWTVGWNDRWREREREIRLLGGRIVGAKSLVEIGGRTI